MSAKFIEAIAGIYALAMLLMLFAGMLVLTLNAIMVAGWAAMWVLSAIGFLR